MGHTILLSHTTPASICPVEHIRAYMKTRCLTTGPLFTFSDGQPLTRRKCLYFLRHSLEHVGLRLEQYNTHSFRIGAASTAAHEGASESTIQHLGRWRSNAVRAYIHPISNKHM